MEHARTTRHPCCALDYRWMVLSAWVLPRARLFCQFPCACFCRARSCGGRWRRRGLPTRVDAGGRGRKHGLDWSWSCVLAVSQETRKGKGTCQVFEARIQNFAEQVLLG